MTARKLVAEGFEHIGVWRTPACRVHRLGWIKRKPDIYAFVVGDRVRYIGQANALHRRLRNYSNRCFRRLSAKPLRRCHSEIVDAINAGQSVYVYAKLVDESDLTSIETELTRKFDPRWDRTRRISG